MGFNGLPGHIEHYYKREKDMLDEAYGTYGQPTLEELRMARIMAKLTEQSYNDRRDTRDKILSEMGFKIGVGDNGKNTLVPLTREERIAAMTAADRSRSAASAAYGNRAKAALTGTSKLPSFLKKDIDAKKVMEEAAMEEILGPDAANSTAGRQAMEALRKKEESVRQRLQDDDIAMTPNAALGLQDQLERGRGRRIRSFEALPQVNKGLLSGYSNRLQELQGARIEALNKRLGEIENKRQAIQNLVTLGGTFGGGATSYANNRKTNHAPEASTYDYETWDWSNPEHQREWDFLNSSDPGLS